LNRVARTGRKEAHFTDTGVLSELDNRRNQEERDNKKDSRAKHFDNLEIGQSSLEERSSGGRRAGGEPFHVAHQTDENTTLAFTGG